MIGPRYGEPCECEACTVAGVRGHRVICTGLVDGQPVWAHGRELARLEQTIADALAEIARQLKRVEWK